MQGASVGSFRRFTASVSEKMIRRIQIKVAIVQTKIFATRYVFNVCRESHCLYFAMYLVAVAPIPQPEIPAKNIIVDRIMLN